MKRKSLIAAFAVACLVALATSAFAIPDKWKASIPVSGEPVAVAVAPAISPEIVNRWVFVASKVTGDTGVIHVIDTWVWEEQTSASVTLRNTGAQPVDIIVSKDGSNLYVTDTMGYLTQIDLAPLSDFKLWETLTLPTVHSCRVDSTGLGEIATAPIPGSLVDDQYIMVGVPGNGGAGVGTGGPGIATFKQTDITGNTATTCPTYSTVSTTISGNNGIPRGMAAGIVPGDTAPFDYLAHIALDFSTAADSHDILPFATPTQAFLIPFALNDAISTYVLGDLAVNEAGDKVFIAATDDIGNEELFAQIVSIADTWIPAGTITLATATRDISIADTVTDPGSTNVEALYVAVSDTTEGNSTLRIYYADTLDPATTVAFTGRVLTDVAPSSALDGYVYLAGSNTTSSQGQAYVVTANPWISNVTASPTVNDGTAPTVASFTSDTDGTYSVFIGNTEITISINTITAESTTTFSLKPTQLAEGNNEVLIVVTDSVGREGRYALVVTKSTLPAAVSFDLGFGNASMIVSIETLNRTDISNYTIYYSSTLADIASESPSTLTTAVITNFSVNSTVKQTITGLVNGTTYYVRVRAFDENSLPGPLSDIKSTMPQNTQSLTSMKGEKGCSMGAPSEAPGLEFWTLIAIALALFEALKLKVRRVHS